jgi:type IV pilus assembly protein PilY1
VIVRGGAKDSRFYGREEVAYVGDLNGMLHAVRTQTGQEKWAYIPSNLLGKLKNVRGDPNAVQDFAAVDASPTVKHIYYDLDHNPDAIPLQAENPTWHSILVCPQGFGGKSIFALDVTDPDDWKVLWETTVADPDPNTPGGGMGHSFRASLDRIKVKVPVLDEFNEPIPGQYDYKVEWRVFVATSFTDIVEEKGGINVFAFDLRTGEKKWTFSSEYANSVNDIPGAITTFDTDDDTFADRIFVGDMNGRLWTLDANDPDPDVSGDPDRSIYNTSGGTPIPLFSAGVDYPISVSPAIVRHNGHVLLVFGTGGADWAAKDLANRIYVLDATRAEQLLQAQIDDNYTNHDAAEIRSYYHQLPVGQKVWSSPTIAAGQIWVASSPGTMESADPNNDTLGQGQLQVLDMEASSLLPNGLPIPMGKVRGSLYVSHGHVYGTAIDGTIIQFGDENFLPGTANRVVLKAWQDR